MIRHRQTGRAANAPCARSRNGARRQRHAAGTHDRPSLTGDRMDTLKFLLAVDGSDGSSRTVDHVIRLLRWYKPPVEVQLLNVQLPILSGNVKTFIRREQLEEYYRDEGARGAEGGSRTLRSGGVGVHLSHRHRRTCGGHRRVREEASLPPDLHRVRGAWAPLPDCCSGPSRPRSSTWRLVRSCS